MFSVKLKVLNVYLSDIFKHDWICEFKNSITASILFSLKKDDELQLCINYQELNAVIIKN